jgi:hypothetical protein
VMLGGSHQWLVFVSLHLPMDYRLEIHHQSDCFSGDAIQGRTMAEGFGTVNNVISGMGTTARVIVFRPR